MTFPLWQVVCMVVGGMMISGCAGLILGGLLANCKKTDKEIFDEYSKSLKL